MSTKEIAYKIIERLTEEQLQEFISLFGTIYLEDKEQEERNNAFIQLQNLRKSVPNFDEKKNFLNIKRKDLTYESIN